MINFVSAHEILFFQEEYVFELPAPGIMEMEIIATDVTVEEERAIVEITEGTCAPAQDIQPDAINGAHPELQHADPPVPPLQAQSQLQLQPSIQPQLPLLYDMDLERMHMHLYKGKYLTPQNFLDDITKIVHNAAARVHGNQERLHKAQAMLIAAEVSMQEFDPQFQLECQRMAERERKRRDERKKAKGKNSAPDMGQNGTYAPGTRRSARHTGQQPEMSITDPLQLERRLKRARSSDRPSGSPESSEENQAEGSGTPRQPKKRLRAILSDDEHDPINLLGPVTSQQSKTATVRFVDDGRAHQDELPVISEPHQPGIQPPTDLPSVGAPSDAMPIDSPVPRRSGFDPFLLNPLPPEEDMMRSATLAPLLNGITSNSGGHDVSLHPSSPQQNGYPQTPMHSPPAHPPSRTPTLRQPPDTDALPVIPSPHEPARSPTPLPDFHVDEESLLNLEFQLQTRTNQLSVEQLEQLRAMCLSNIWNHRTEWDRDRLVQELLDVLDAFLEDCSVGTSDTAPGSPEVLAY